MEKIELGTPDGAVENIEKIAELFPQVVTEVENTDGELARAVDFDALRDLLGDVAEGQRERYQFTWPGKREAKAEARRPIYKTMIPELAKSNNWGTTENLYIEGDNLDALKILKETYAGKVKLIYIDPPYNTGHDFVYDDDFAKTRGEYDAESGDFDEEGGRLVANTEGNGRFHSDWCSMIYPRLLLARDLLAADGAIFISIDDNESSNLRKICDEVFGAACFVGDVIWQKTYSPRNDSKGIPTVAEHLLCYGKSSGWVPKRLPRTESMNAGYGSPDGDGLLWASGDPAAAGGASHQGMVYGIQHPFTGEVFYPPMGSHWRVGQPGLLSILNEWAPYELRDIDDAQRRAEVCGIGEGEVREGVKAVMLAVSFDEARTIAQRRYDAGSWPLLYFTGGGTGGMRRKRYLDESQGRVVDNLWLHEEVGHTDEAKKQLKALFDGSAPFDTPKPVRLMRRILDIASSKDCTVLDFFSGSASMAQAVMEKNAEDSGSRRFVLVQIPEMTTGQFSTLTEIGEERIRRAGAKIAAGIDESNKQLELGAEPKPYPDLGFRVLRIDSSNFKDFYLTPGETAQESLFDFADNVKEGRSDLDLLFEVLPKLGIPYSAKIEERVLADKKVFFVDGDKLAACFDANVGSDTIEEMAKAKPWYAVIRDSSMADDATHANYEELFRTYSPDTVPQVI
ncbi:site-specific DNA-methyltransferase [Ellagibacter isourolithinifaciens]|uniref:Site-specific DNA-methyltransferase n=1 Tax=Ellagibacter isourolithinifaciens TaxID=2137581 RepID=A0A6N6NQC7_9ACTN|nr:site-specific DNA-methyltransferase [Ellagibacter isourolithinifaciens]KAB1641791.1 site-specific DNA-methyltransferase [Ellagibacter isourolithinifaciens]